MKIYNTMSQKKEEFVPRVGKSVKMYACGITVSRDAHIGHFLQALIYDIMRKYLIKKGFNVTYCRNYTDVDDKIIEMSNKLGIDAKIYSEKMVEKTNREMKLLQVDEPDIWMKVTTSMDEIIKFVSVLIEKGHAYVADSGDVYFSVESFPNYGKLSNRNTEDSIDGVRIELEDGKKSPLDFALWKSAKKGEISWDSPWGKGRPGWHIECSAMNLKALGEQIDIHGGGRDLIFPHHENEIAQTEAYTGKQFAKYWTHNGLIKVNGQKMSKSLNNGILLEDLIKEYHPEVVKFSLLQTSYRNDINITDHLFSDSEKHLLNFNNILKQVDDKFGVSANGNKIIDDDFVLAMDDDFNTAKAIANLFGYFKNLNTKIKENDKTAADDVCQIRKTYALLGLFVNNAEEIVLAINKKYENTLNIPKEVLLLANQRLKARINKDWSESDRLRTEISKLGYSIKDKQNEFELSKD